MTTQPTGIPMAGAHPGAAPDYSRKLFAVLVALLLAVTLGSEPVRAQDGPAAAGAAQTVNINSDDAATLAAVLNGVGLSRAEDIVRYREEFGPFTTVEQLSEVKGIGEATLDKNRARITLE